MMFELARPRSCSQRSARAASAVGYVAIELAKEAPYHAGAFGTALLSDTVDSPDTAPPAVAQAPFDNVELPQQS